MDAVLDSGYRELSFSCPLSIRNQGHSRLLQRGYGINWAVTPAFWSGRVGIEPKDMTCLKTNRLAPFNRAPLRGALFEQNICVSAKSILSASYAASGISLLKHKWLILAVTFLLNTVLVAFYSFKEQPVYEATSRVDVEAEMPAPANIE